MNLNNFPAVFESMAKSEAKNLFSYSPRIFIIFGLLAYIVTGKLGYVMLSVYVVVTEIIVNILKNFFGENLPESLSKRPGGVNCDPYGSDIGMPSGHSAIAAMFTTFVIAKIWATPGFALFKILRSVLMMVFALSIMVSRTGFLENCHTTPQVIVGGFVGVVMGLLFWWLQTFLPRFLKI